MALLAKAFFMKKPYYLPTIILLVILELLSSCVAKRKYVSAMNNAGQMRTQNAMLNDKIRYLDDSLLYMYNQVADLKKGISNLGDTYQSTNKELNMSKEQVIAQRKRLMQLEALIDQQKKATEDLRKKVADALTNFNTSELTVTVKNGKVYVSMQESLLFPSGSAVVNPKGKVALAKVADVLIANPDINVNIEGHTDTVPIHNKMYNDNWSLSVARAVSITHVLTDNYNVIPARIIASGRSKYDPVATNESAAGRALNRRTEVILEPKLNELMNLIYGDNTIGMK
jgi:chemotaxis protein MotB